MNRRKAVRVKLNQDKGTRMCCSCRKRAIRNDLLRFVRDQQGQAWLDPYLKAPGRGAHLCFNFDCIAKAVKKRTLSVSFKESTSLPELDSLLQGIVEAQLNKITNLIGLARRRAELISGLNMLEQAQGELSLLVLSSDIAESSKEKLSKGFQKKKGLSIVQAPFLDEQSMIWVNSNKSLINWLDSLSVKWSGEALGSLIGKAHRVAIGLSNEQVSQQLKQEILRISQVLVASSSR